MDQARDGMDQGEPAGDKQEDALDRLDDAQDQLEQSRKDAEQELQREMMARLSFNTACELGFRGSLDEWERLMGAVARR